MGETCDTRSTTTVSALLRATASIPGRSDEWTPDGSIQTVQEIHRAVRGPRSQCDDQPRGASSSTPPPRTTARPPPPVVQDGRRWAEGPGQTGQGDWVVPLKINGGGRRRGEGGMKAG
eukprot:CAMPEP_0184717826 /NCGR_PEP_ID=MMETSP0314-20130426/7181_1 /TAXON_ID=38298 /ORGANISM="Rhodella maculata, Strain CCMP 736" /LENGTH=117 /DNA_ID=CAMNT_0027181463 /DNA_START=321 /DNA_END=675 /DNA_ORIENTATION=-